MIDTGQPARNADPLSIGVLGGGRLGLACAHYLLDAGLHPVLLEPSDVAGRDCQDRLLGESGGLFTALAERMQWKDRVVWRETGTGLWLEGRHYSLSRGMDLLGLRPAPFGERWRALFHRWRNRLQPEEVRALDRRPARDWLADLCGEPAAACVWEPWLRARYGVWWREVSAYSVWHWLSKSHPARPVLGALRGGGALMAADLVDSIEARGGEVWVNAPLTRIEEEAAWVRVDSGPVVERFDSVISTLPLEDLSAAACGYLRRNIPAPAAPRCGRVTALLELDRPLARFTRTVAPGTDTPFLELIETTHVAPPAWLGGRTLVEARGWGGGDSPLFREPEAVLRGQAAAFLRSLYPRFDPGLIRSIRIDREPDAEPVWTTGSFERLPTRRAGHTQVFLCQPEHVYPSRLGWESALRLAKETVTDLCVDMVVANRHASDVLA